MPVVNAGSAVAVLYPGDLGSNLARLLGEQGHRVVTTVEGRSPRTRRLAREANIEVLGSLREVLESAAVIFSVVPPAAALSLARQCCSCSRRPAVFVDLNAISPETARHIEAVVTAAGMSFVDGAIHGMAAQLRSRGTLYLSGPEAPKVANVFGRSLRVRVLGDKPGDASAFKMLISGMAKGVVALFLEMSLAARQAGLVDDLLACYREAYPGIMALVDRLLPTYPQHAQRRGDELNEVEQTMLSLGVEPCMVAGARRITAGVGRMDLAELRASADAAHWSVLEVIEEVFIRNPLSVCESATPRVTPRDPVEAV